MIFENSRVRIFDLSKILLLQNLASCGENEGLWEKGGVFGSWSIFLLEYLSLCLNKCVDLEIGKWVWFQKQTKWWQRMIQICQIWIKNNFCSQLHWCCTSIGCFLMCWHKSPKTGRLKGKCALGPFLVYFCDWVPNTYWMSNYVPNDEWSANQQEGMILDLVHWFLCTNIFV